jgi:hypothetical protein
MKHLNEDMNPLEQTLKKALRREAAPENFAVKVLARASQSSTEPKVQRNQWFSFFSRPLIRWSAFATVAICLIVGGVHYRNVQRERAKGEAAKQQLMLALRIAGSKLQLAKERVHEINTRPGPQTAPRTSRSRS